MKTLFSHQPNSFNVYAVLFLIEHDDVKRSLIGEARSDGDTGRLPRIMAHITVESRWWAVAEVTTLMSSTRNMWASQKSPVSSEEAADGSDVILE